MAQQNALQYLVRRLVVELRSSMCPFSVDLGLFLQHGVVVVEQNDAILSGVAGESVRRDVAGCRFRSAQYSPGHWVSLLHVCEGGDEVAER